MERPKRRFRKWLWLVGFSAVFLLGSFYVFYQTYLNMPDFTLLRKSVELQIVKRDGSKGIKKVGPRAAGWVPMGQISDGVTFAVVASEDTSYFSHKGIDVHELKEAIKKDLQERRFARGASTITQQVVKNAFLSQEKSLWRKFREILWAAEMDKALSKTEVLNFYLNMVEWGPGIYGIGEAARHYFESSPASLSAKQGAFLAMLLPSPRRYYVSFKNKELTAYAQKRVDRILRIMFRMKYITEEAYEYAKSEPLFGVPEPPENAIAIGEDLDGEPDESIDVRDVKPDQTQEIEGTIIPSSDESGSSASNTDATDSTE